MHAAISVVQYHLPEKILTNRELAEMFPEWSAEKIAAKTGIEQRHVSAADECPSDLAEAAARKLFNTGACSPGDVDFLLVCTQAPDYILPATACLLQHRLGLPMRAGAFDFNLGCSGFVYGLSLAKGLIETRQAKNVLLLTTDTLTKFLHPTDRGSRSLLGDGAAATLIQGRHDAPPGHLPWIGPFVFGTDGQGKDHLIIRTGGMRQRGSAGAADEMPSPDHFFMNGPEVFTFTLRVVPQTVKEILERAETTLDGVDLFVFHQANAYILEHLRQKLKVPAEKFVVALSQCGNTASSTIPIALHEARARGQLRPGMRVMLVAFGVGYSWSATMIHSW